EGLPRVLAASRGHLLVRGARAAATYAVLDWLSEQDTECGRRVEYSLRWAIGEAERAAIGALSATAWSPAINADGDIREGADVAELTGLVDLGGWPQRMRVIVRRERPHPLPQLPLFKQADGGR